MKEIPEGSFGIIMSNGDGTASQIGLTEIQNEYLKAFLASISSEEEPLRKLPKEYNLEKIRMRHELFGSQESLAMYFSDKPTETLGKYREELTQVASIAIAIIQDLDKNGILKA